MADDKRPGRPPLDATAAPSTSLHLRLTAAEYERIGRLALTRRESIQALIRRGLKQLAEARDGV